MKTNKIKILSIIITLALTICIPFFADAQHRGQRPPHRGHYDKSNHSNYNSLPAPAKNFLNKHFKKAQIKEIDFKPHYRTYEVELKGDIDLDFDHYGNCIKIDSDRAIPTSAVKSMLPNKAYNYLKKDKNHDDVESIEINNRGYKVELHKGHYDELYFDKQGNLTRKTN